MFLAISAYKKHKANKKLEHQNQNNNSLNSLDNDNPNQNREQPNTVSPLGSTIAINIPTNSNHHPILNRKEARSAEEEAFRKIVIKRQIIQIGILVFVDIALPLALYFSLRNHISVILALIISGIPPLLNVIYTFIRKRKIDVLGCLFVLSFILSGVISLVTGNARIALLRESAVTGLLCILFFVTTIPVTTPWFVNRPLVYLIAQELYKEQPPLRWVDEHEVEQQQSKIEWAWNKYKPFRIHCYAISLMWSVGLGGEFLSRVLMVECTTLTIDEVVKYGTIIVATVSSVLGVVTIVSTAIIRKKSNIFMENWMEENDHYDLLNKTDNED